jgi:uncharacterized membrane protein
MARARWSVRRFAAIDMYGAAGTLRRRRLVLGEFVLGSVCLILLGLFFAVHGAWPWAVWLFGCGLSYVALAVHAAALYPPGRLEAALESVDTAAELRRYSTAQLLLLVPALIAVVAVAQARPCRPDSATDGDVGRQLDREDEGFRRRC